PIVPSAAAGPNASNYSITYVNGVLTVGNPPNQAPSYTKGANQTAIENAGAQSVSNWATSISKGPANESSQSVAFRGSNGNTSLFSAQPAISSSGTLTYAP